MFKFHVNVPITDNINKLIIEWSKLSDVVVRVFDIEEAKKHPELRPYYDDLAFGFINPFTREFEIYVSDVYPEAHIIHETLHQILRFEGYCVTKVFLRDKAGLPDYIIRLADEFQGAIINHMDHLIINIRIHDYDLDFNNMYRVEYSKMKKNFITLQNIELDERRKLLYGLLFAIRSFDCYSYLEPYKQDIFNLHKKVDKKGFDYGKKLYDIVVNNGYLSKEDFKKSILILINEANKIWHSKLDMNKDDPIFSVFKIIKIVT